MISPATIFAAILALAPLDAPRLVEEPREEMVARLHDISEDVAAVANEDAPSDAVAAERAAMLLGVARHEAGRFERDVDIGPCVSAAGRCDRGRSVSIFQLLERDVEKRALYQRDRRAAAREALRRAGASVRRCRGQGPAWAAYASGRCDRGHQAARELERFVLWARMHLDAAIRRAEDPYADS